MSETVTIRAARREDVPAILVIYNATVKEPAAAYEDSPNTLHQREEWFDYYQQRNFPILVAERPGWWLAGVRSDRIRSGAGFALPVGGVVCGCHVSAARHRWLAFGGIAGKSP